MTAGARWTRGAILLAAICFGTLAFFAELALRAGVDPLMFVLGRFAAASVVLGLASLATRNKGRRPTPGAAAAALLIGVAVYAGQALTLTIALDRSDASLVAVLFGTYPAFVLVFLALTGRRHLRPWLLGPMAGVLAGSTMLVARAPSGAVTASAVALALVSAALFAVFVVGSNALIGRVDPITLATLCCVGAVVSVLIAAAATQRLDFDFDPEGWLWIAAAGTVSTAVAFLALFRSLPAVGPATAGIVLGAEPLVTVALAVAFLGDHLAALQLAGAGVVVASVAVLQRRAVASEIGEPVA